MRRFLLAALPAALVAAFAASSFWPARDALPGGESYFNLWTFEVVWRHLETLGPLRLFSDAFWRAPLFADAPNGLAYSENQIYAALVLWPVRALAHNGAVALDAGAIAMVLLAFVCAAGFLRATGASSFACWGGLLFAACGWLQSQYAHYQNLCIFLLPLALWAWLAFAARPGLLRLAICALAFGWIGGWNMYFQVFANACLGVLAARALWTGRVPRTRVAILLALTALVELPIASRYFAVGHVIGGFHVLGTYGATWRSLIGSAHRPRALFPSFEVPIESAGYLGIGWLALVALSLRRKAARPWVLASAVAFWAALGAGFGLFDLLELVVPGVGGLRAIGRAQILVALLSLPAVAFELEGLRPTVAAGALALVLAELLPASRPDRLHVDPKLWGPLTPFSRKIAEADDPLLVLPHPDATFMLGATQTFTPYFGGSSGHAPHGQDFLLVLAARGPFSPEDALDFTGARRIVALTPPMTAALAASQRARFIGCFEHLDGAVHCLFESAGARPARLSLVRDARWELRVREWPEGDLRATAAGVLDIGEVDRCQLRQTLRFPHLPPLRHEMGLQTSLLRGVRFASGDLILHNEAHLQVFRLPAALRPSNAFDAVCAP